MAGNSREALLRDVSAVFCEFLEAATHTLLYIRNVYPPEIFDRRRKYNVPVRQSRHKELNDYISGAIADVRHWMDKGLVEKVVLSIEDSATREQIERFVFEVDVDVTGQLRSPTKGAGSVSASSHAELEDAFKQVLLKINVADSLLAPLRSGGDAAREVSFSLYVHAATVLDASSADDWEARREHRGEEEAGAGAGAGARGGQGAIVPVKSVQAGALRMQLYAQSYASRA